MKFILFIILLCNVSLLYSCTPAINSNKPRITNNEIPSRISSEQEHAIFTRLINSRNQVGAKITFFVETIYYFDWLYQDNDWEIDELREFLNVEAPVILNIDDILIINYKDLGIIDNYYSTVIVLDDEYIYNYGLDTSTIPAKLSSRQRPRHLYGSIYDSNEDIKPVYFLRCISGLTISDESICSSLEHGIQEHLGSQYYTEINSLYDELIETNEIGCNSDFLEWSMQWDGEVRKYCIDPLSRNSSILGFRILREEKPDIDEYLAAAECN